MHANNTYIQSAALEVAVRAGKLDVVSRKRQKIFCAPDIVMLLMSAAQIGIILCGNVILHTSENLVLI